MPVLVTISIPESRIVQIDFDSTTIEGKEIFVIQFILSQLCEQ
jgi:hypothetical protein